jgi:hypothetical protein
VKVVLSESALQNAAIGGVMRGVDAIMRKARPRFGADPLRAWQDGIEGCIGELVVAQYLCMYWAWDVGIVGAKDLGTNIQVRCTGCDTGHLLLHPQDCDDDVFWFVTGLGDTYHIRGTITGKAGKACGIWRDSKGNGRHCYWVHQSQLTPLHDDVRPMRANGSQGIPLSLRTHTPMDNELAEWASTIIDDDAMPMRKQKALPGFSGG